MVHKRSVNFLSDLIRRDWQNVDICEVSPLSWSKVGEVIGDFYKETAAGLETNVCANEEGSFPIEKCLTFHKETFPLSPYQEQRHGCFLNEELCYLGSFLYAYGEVTI